MSAALAAPAPALPSASARSEALTVVGHSRAVLAEHGRSFWLASLFLSRSQADDAAVVYAWCRLVDDLADEAPDRAQALLNLDCMQAELTGAATPRPLVAAFLEVCWRRDIDLGAAEELLRGVRSDLDTVRLDDDAALVRYAYRVAGTVGLMMCGVLGVTAPEARQPAIDLGVAMQLTNICRDVLEDAGRDRVYLPATRLQAAGTSAQALLTGQAPGTAVATVVTDLLALADRGYAHAHEGMRHIPARPRLAILVASRVYRAIGLRLLQRHAGDPMHGRTVVPTGRRLLAVLRSVVDFVFEPATRPGGPRRAPPPGWSRHLAGLPGGPVVQDSPSNHTAP